MLEMDLPPTAFPQAQVRHNDLQSIIQYLKYGDTCCSLIAPSNMGKSILLRSLQAQEVRRHLAGEDETVVVIFVDCLPLGDDPSGRTFYEMMAQHIGYELQSIDTALRIWETPNSVRAEVFSMSEPAAVRSWFDSHIRRLMHESQITLVLVLDEFDQIYCTLNPEPLNQLVALKDEFRERLRYVVSTSRSLRYLREDESIYEFRELFHLSTHILRPLSGVDSRQLVHYLAKTQNVNHNERFIPALVELSGGHPGLLKRLYMLFHSNMMQSERETLATLAGKLIKEGPIRKECQRLWSELETGEQEELLDFVSDLAWIDADQHFASIMAKGLLVKRGTSLDIFSPIFKHFVVSEREHEEQEIGPGIYCDVERRRVWIDGREVTDQIRSSNHLRLLMLLFEKQGRLCTYQEIAEELHGTDEGVTDESIKMVVSRLKAAIPECAKYIVNVEREGYRLAIPGQ